MKFIHVNFIEEDNEVVITSIGDGISPLILNSYSEAKKILLKK